VAGPKAPLLDAAGKKSKELSLEASIFGAEVKPHLVHEAVRGEQNAQRAGTRGAKSRGLVAGGRGKPWRQKGTGRARAGTIRAPQFTGGGVAFPPGRRNFETKVNRRAQKAALRSALSSHASAGTLAVVDAADFVQPSTRRAVEFVAGWETRLPLVVVAQPDEEHLAKSFRNLQGVLVLSPAEVEVTSLVWARSLLVSEAALELLQQRAASA
jgi:large subunit ribosomal protein L4